MYPAALPQLLEMARLHEERACELLQAGDPDGWTDLFAAVTAWPSVMAGGGSTPDPWTVRSSPLRVRNRRPLERNYVGWRRGSTVPPSVPTAAVPGAANALIEPVRE